MGAPSRGEIWWVDLNPVKGHEQSGRRPGLVLSVDTFNHGPAGMAVIIPVTKTDRKIPSHVPVGLEEELNAERHYERLIGIYS